MSDAIEKKDREKEEPEYRTAIDFLSGYNGKINSLSNQLNFLTAPAYQPTLLSALTGMQKQLSSFMTIEAMLPKFNNLAAVSPAFDLSRKIMLDGITFSGSAIFLSNSIVFSGSIGTEANPDFSCSE